jgi:NAD(P)H-hydrate epimerase
MSLTSEHPPENTPALWRDAFPHPNHTSHKYSRGTALIRGGSLMTGATRLAARAAQRMGAGLVTLAAPMSALPIYAEALESVIVRPCDTLPEWQALIDDAHHPALLIGPGLGVGQAARDETLAALAAKRPTVIDADALTSFADQPDLLFAHLHPACILTPHEGEFARLFSSQSFQEPKAKDEAQSAPQSSPAPRGRGEGGGGLAFETRISLAQAASHRAGCILLLKGAETIIAAPDDQTVINRNAPPWLATAGSGDTLAGMILGLIAQKMPPFEAACAAAWMHGHAATLHGPGLIAEDIVATIPAVLREFMSL